MENKKNVLYAMMIMLSGVFNFAVQAQQKNGIHDTVITQYATGSQGPKGIVRTIKQDRNGHIWITSWEGVFKYDGKTFTNITGKVSSARFFSVLEDKKGNFWFSSVGSGVYYYSPSVGTNGKSFQHFTTRDGLASDRVGDIYEDKTGTIWFGTDNGVSRYNPSASLKTGEKSFQNLKLNQAPPAIQADSVYVGSGPASNDSVHISVYQHKIPEVHWMHNDVNTMMEDQTGKFWFGTRGYAAVYDGKTFKTITREGGRPFINVRSIIRDRKGNIWLGGAKGLWRYDGKIFKNFTQKFVGYIFEDKKGNIWTSSESSGGKGWALSRYDEKSLSAKKPVVNETAHQPMIFGIAEDDHGNIWFGGFDGVYGYDGKSVKDIRK